MSVYTMRYVFEKGAIVKDSIIMSGTVIKAGAIVNYSIIDSNTTIAENAIVGEDKKSAKGITVIGSDIIIGADSKVEAGLMIDTDFNNGNGAN
mgnify:CR=1 FL=1